MLKPIDTFYKGYKFRSRLEARWAVFFDVMGIEWRYEDEGYVLQDGTYYLPDFYLPSEDAFVEIKPRKFSEKERKKCELLCEGTKKYVFLLDGIPEYRAYEVFFFSDNVYLTEGGSSNGVHCMDVVMCNYKRERGRMYFSTGYGEGALNVKGFTKLWGDAFYYPDFITAINKSKSMRFEHGE